MLGSVRRIPFLLCFIGVIALAGCSDSDPVSGPATDPAVIQAAAGVASVAASDAEGATETATGLMSTVTPVPAAGGTLTSSTTQNFGSPGELLSSSQAAVVLTCPPSGDLPNGVSFVCAENAGTLTFEFTGSLATPGGNLSLEGSLVARPSQDQTGSSIRYDVDLSASGSGPRGVVSWSGGGYVLIDESGAVTDYRLNLTHVASTAADASAISTVEISPDSLDLRVTSGTVTVRFALDRGSGTGTAQLNGTTVANVTFVDGCVVIDYLDSSRSDETVCSAD